MILFKIAKWMEERNKLDSSIREARGDTRLLLHQREQVDYTIRSEASRWLGNGVTLAPALALKAKPSLEHSLEADYSQVL
jgi:hypothetical protein